jgi:ribosomal protein S12 methylthiotransferase accessory factor
MEVGEAIAVVEAEYRRCGFTAELTRRGPNEAPVYGCVVRDVAGRVVSEAAGKGLAPAQSRASALFEGWEHFQLNYGLARLAGDPALARAIDIREVLGQAALREEAMLRRLAIDYPHARVGCLRFTGVSGPRAEVWYPAFVKSPFCGLHPVRGDDLVYRPYLRYASSNGSASGTDGSEALLHALLELVERDAMSLAYLTWFAGDPPGRVRVVDPATLPEDLQELREVITGVLGAPPRLLDVTTDLGVPCYCAVPSLPDPARVGLHGAGASLSPAYAAERALCELLQFAMTRPARDDSRRRKAAELQRWPLLQRCFVLHPADLSDLPQQHLGLDPSPARPRQDIHGQLAQVLDLLATHGYQAYWLDWAPEESTARVVAACVPGLEAFSIHVDNGIPVLPTGRGIRHLAAADDPADVA